MTTIKFSSKTVREVTLDFLYHIEKTIHRIFPTYKIECEFIDESDDEYIIESNDKNAQLMISEFIENNRVVFFRQ